MTRRGRGTRGGPYASHAGADAVRIVAIGREGWPLAERLLETATRIVIEDTADQVRGLVRADTGWTPTIRVLDEDGNDLSSLYNV